MAYHDRALGPDDLNLIEEAPLIEAITQLEGQQTNSAAKAIFSGMSNSFNDSHGAPEPLLRLVTSRHDAHESESPDR